MLKGVLSSSVMLPPPFTFLFSHFPSPLYSPFGGGGGGAPLSLTMPRAQAKTKRKISLSLSTRNTLSMAFYLNAACLRHAGSQISLK